MPRNITMDLILSAVAGVTKEYGVQVFNGAAASPQSRRDPGDYQEHNYEPNAFARLKARESNVVGVVVPTLNSKITSRVVTSIGRYLREQGMRPLLRIRPQH